MSLWHLKEHLRSRLLAAGSFQPAYHRHRRRNRIARRVLGSKRRQFPKRLRQGTEQRENEERGVVATGETAMGKGDGDTEVVTGREEGE